MKKTAGGKERRIICRGVLGYTPLPMLPTEHIANCPKLIVL
jgi:hypothetical protein